jgi:two-component system, LuxR family, response regulator FixJ
MAKQRDKAHSPITVVVVDDDPAVRNSLQFSLELEGFAVRVYADGRALLDDPRLPVCGCLVVDHVMPGMSGLDVVDALRQRGISSPAILITPSAGGKLRQRAAWAGVMVIEKPFFGTALVDAIRDSLGP